MTPGAWAGRARLAGGGRRREYDLRPAPSSDLSHQRRPPAERGDRLPRRPASSRDRDARASRVLPLGGGRSGARAGPRDHLHVGHVVPRRPLSGGALHRHRPRSTRPRRVGQAAWRLLAARVRERDPRPAVCTRPPVGDIRRAFAGRRHRDAARVPVPRALRAVGSGEQRRAGSRHHRVAARRQPAGLGAGAPAGGRRAGRWRRPGGRPPAGHRRPARPHRPRRGPARPRFAVGPRRARGVRAHAEDDRSTPAGSGWTRAVASTWRRRSRS